MGPGIEFASSADVRQRFDEQGYLADEGISTAILLATRLGMPLLLEGEPGVGRPPPRTRWPLPAAYPCFGSSATKG